jgi:hypothetical protein
MNSLAMVQALAFEPKKAFAEIAERPRFLFPLLLAVIATAALMFWYFRVVDVEWFTDQQLRSSGVARVLTEAQIEERVKRAGENPGRIAVITAVTTALGLVIGHLLISLYYLLAGKITNVQRGFRQWFALSCWTSLPSLLTLIPAAIMLLTTSTTQIAQEELRALSLNALIFHRTAGDPLYQVLSSIGIPEILAIILMVMGVRAWSGRSWIFSAIFTLLPTLFIGGLVALFMASRS